MTENKVFPEYYLLCVNFDKFSSINAMCNQSKPSILVHYDWLYVCAIYWGEFLKMTLFTFIITSVKFQLKLLSAKFLLFMNSL